MRKTVRRAFSCAFVSLIFNSANLVKRLVVNVKDLEFARRLKQVSLERKFSFSRLLSSSSFFDLSIAFTIIFANASTTSVVVSSASLITFITLSLSIDMSLLS